MFEVTVQWFRSRMSHNWKCSNPASPGNQEVVRSLDAGSTHEIRPPSWHNHDHCSSHLRTYRRTTQHSKSASRCLFMHAMKVDLCWYTDQAYRTTEGTYTCMYACTYVCVHASHYAHEEGYMWWLPGRYHHTPPVQGHLRSGQCSVSQTSHCSLK